MSEKKTKKIAISVGVVGQISAGKGELVRYLTEKLGFSSFSLSTVVHNELNKKRISKFTRTMLQDEGDKLRRRYGDDILAKRIFRVIKEQKKDMFVIEGIRNPAEIKFFKKNKNFILIGVKANRKIRFARLLSRNRVWDPKTYGDFLKVDQRDLGLEQGKSGQQVGKCLLYCDYILTNNDSLENFEKKLEKLFIHKLFPSQFVGK